MESYVTEEQQWEAIKNFFKKYGNSMLWVAIIVLGSISAWRYWQHYQGNQRLIASESYQELLIAYADSDYTTVNTKAKYLKDHYDNTLYAALASMVAGKVAFKDGDVDIAKQNYQWAVDHSPSSDFKRLAQYRLMKLYMIQGELEQALVIAQADANGLMPLFKELEGDIYIQKQERELALKAYQAAFAANDVSPFLKMKLEDLGQEVH